MSTGTRYIDYVMSWGPLIHGHAPAGLIKALAAAAKRGTSFGAPTELETRLARRVAMLMPSMERIRFVSSGTEAAMSAVRVARAATKRDKIIKFAGCYHGHADSLPRAGGIRRDDARRADEPWGSRRRRPPTRCWRATTISIRSRRMFTAHRGQIAALIVEPIAGNMGLVPPRDGFLAGLRAICDREGDPPDLRRGDLRLPRRRRAARSRSSASRRT